MLKLMFTSEIF